MQEIEQQQQDNTPVKVSYLLPEGADQRFVPSRSIRNDGRQDTGWDLRAYSIEFSDRTIHGRWDKFLKAITFGLYKPIPCYIKVCTGVSVQADDPTIGFEIRMNSRSSKTPFILGNTDGTIDPGYTGQMYMFFNPLNWATWDDINEYFQIGAVVGQLIPEKQVDVEMLRSMFLLDTDRNTGGFGSTKDKNKMTV